ncbi:MAG: radical SAM protein [Candidatus Altiarchaeota archaeon]
MADVLLVKPNYAHDIAITPPMGLCYIAATLEEEGFRVSIIDNTLERIDDDKLGERIRQENPQMIGVYSSTPIIYEALKVARQAKKQNTKIHVCMGGPHPSAIPEEVLAEQSVDSVCIGEGEGVVVDLMETLSPGTFDKVEGLAYRESDGGIVKNKVRPVIDDLDDIPFPAIHLLKVEEYFSKSRTYGVDTRSPRNLPVMSTRGCPNQCTFCQRFLGNKFRRRSPGNVVDEIEELAKKYRLDEIHFIDDNFTLIKEYSMDVCDEMLSRRIGVQFKFPNGVREDRVDAELLDKLRETGCYALDFGIESGSQKVLDLMRKGKKTGEIREKVLLTKKKGFHLTASFLFGTPGETISDMEETIRFAKSLPLDGCDFGIITPYPGTQVYLTALEKNYLVHREYDKYVPTLGICKPALRTEDWTPEDLTQIQKKAFREFYCRPKYIASAIPNMLNPSKLRKYAGFLYNSMRK